MKKTSTKPGTDISSKGIKTEWDLSLFYKSITDPQLEKDVQATEVAYENFAKKYQKNNEYTTNTKKLLTVLKDWEQLMKASSGKPARYLHCITDLDASNTKAASLSTVFLERLTKASNKTLFFELNLGKIAPKLQKSILADKSFSDFRYYLEVVFKNAAHNLSEAEEKIMSLKSGPSYRMWVDAQKKFFSTKTIPFKGRELSTAEAIDLRMNLPLKDRTVLHKKLMTLCKEVSFFAEAELTAIINNKKTSDELRGFSSPEEATILHYQNDKKSIDTLVQTITKYFTVAHKFYKLKSKLMGMPHISLADISVSIGKTAKKINFTEAVELIRSSFAKADPRFTEIFNKMLSNGQIDVFPKKGKRGGAYCGWSYNQPTLVFMNYVDGMRSVETLAHEMGHAIHGELSKGQSIFYEDCTISVAEVASTFFENVLFDYVFPTLPEKEKIAALFGHIQDDVSTIFRQIAFYNYEKEMHSVVREKGGMSKEEFASLYSKHLKSYLGPAVKLSEDDGYGYVYVPHFRYFFYVYSYAYGQIISKAMYEKYKKDPAFIQQVIKFLSAGGSMSPEDIFKSIEIDTSDPSFFEEGLKSIEADIVRLEKLARKAKMIK